MRKIAFAVAILTTIFVMLSCGNTKKKDELKAEIMWDEIEIVPDTVSMDITKRSVFHASETVYTDLIHTKLEVSFDWAKAWLYGKATLTAKPHFYAQDSLILDAKGMEIKSVSINNAALKYTYKDDFLRIKLDKTYARTEKYTIEIDYIAKPNERQTSGSAAITSDKGLYFINPTGSEGSKMPQIWTQGETESSSVWFPTIDAPNVKTTQEMLITVDTKYTTLSNGKLLASKDNGNGTRTDHWKQELPHAPYLFMMGVGEFKVVKDFYTRPDGSKMEVNYYVEPAWEQYAKAIFGETPKMIQFFSQLTGVEYPWDKYSQIVVRDYVSGAMENTGAVIFGEYAYKTDRELLDSDDNSTIAHELFHHWFGDLVTCESWSNLPLNESFANYSQYLWDEHRYGLDEADFNAEGEKRGYYQSAEYSGSHNLIWYDYEDKEQMFDGHSYNKGGRILHMLRSYLGDDAFFEGLKLYLKTNQFKAADFDHLRHAFEEVSGQDLHWFFNQWFLAKNHPELKVTYDFSVAGKLKVNVLQTQDFSMTPIYRLPVQVMVYDDKGAHNHQITIDQISQTIELPFDGTLKNVIFDYQQSLLAKIDEQKPTSFYVHQYYNGKRYLARSQSLNKATAEMTNEVQQLILDALKDPFWEIRQQAIDFSNKLTGTYANQAMNSISMMVKQDPKSAVRATALGYLGEKLAPMELETVCSERIKNDLSYKVCEAALVALVEKSPKLALAEAKKLESTTSSNLKASISKIYASDGSPELKSYMESLITDRNIAGYDEIIVLNSYVVFCSKQDVSVIQESLNLLRKVQLTGGTYTKMFMPQMLNYYVNLLTARQADSKIQIEELEKKNDVAYASKLRKENEALDQIIKEMNSFKEELMKKK